MGESFLKTLGVRLRENYSTVSFADVVNSIKQTKTAPVEITPYVSLNIFVIFFCFKGCQVYIYCL